MQQKRELVEEIKDQTKPFFFYQQKHEEHIKVIHKFLNLKQEMKMQLI